MGLKTPTPTTNPPSSQKILDSGFGFILGNIFVKVVIVGHNNCDVDKYSVFSLNFIKWK